MPRGKIPGVRRSRRKGFWHAACIGRAGLEGSSLGDVHDHSHRNPSGRPDSADAAAAGARPAACPGDVCRRGRRTLDHRPGAKIAAGGRGLPDQRRPVRLRHCHAGAVYRLPRRRYPAACDDGRDVCLRRTDAVDGGGTRRRPPGHLRCGDRGRSLRPSCRTLCQPPAAAVPARRHRHHHPGDRYLADAGRHQLGGRRLAEPDQDRRWGPGLISKPGLWPIAGARHRAVRAAGDPRPDQMGLRLRRQCRRAARHRRRYDPRGLARHHAFRKSFRGIMGGDRAAAAFRGTEIPARADHHHVHRHDRRDDRVARHVPGAWRHHRQAGRSR